MTPVIWFYYDTVTKTIKRRLIRGTPTKLLSAVVQKAKYAKFSQVFRKNGNTRETELAIIRELRLRMAEGERIAGYTVAAMNTLDPPPCACGSPGTRIVGRTTYCETCAKSSVARRLARSFAHKDHRAVELSKEFDARDQAMRSGLRHHEARGRK